MVKFKYDKKIDIICWQRVIDAGSIFGTKAVEKIDLDKEKIKEAKNKVKIFQKEFDSIELKFYRRIRAVFGVSFPKNMEVFINTTPYSMDDYKNKSISVSYERGGNFITSFVHEASHYMFREKYEQMCKNRGFSQEEIEDIKEVLTVINNIVFSDIIKTFDFSWERHKMLRKQVYQDFEKNRNFKQTLYNLLSFLKENKTQFC